MPCRLALQRGMKSAQALNLHQVRKTTREEALWWSMFSSHRFSSLILGSGCIIPTEQCDLTFKFGEETNPAAQQYHLFMAQLGILAGKVIDLTRAGQRESYDRALALDHEIDQYTTQLTAHDWIAEHWLLPPSSDSHEMRSLSMYLSGYVMFYIMKTFLHMPYMFRAINNQGYNFSRETCFEAARGVIRCVYLTRRGPAEPKFRSFDFLAFLGCVTLLLGLNGYGGLEHKQSESLNDWRLIESTLELFRSVSNGPFDKVASQCYKALLQLAEFGQRSIGQPLMASDNLQVVVPFFGTITIRSGRPQETPVHKVALGPSPGREMSTVDLSRLVFNQTVSEAEDSPHIVYDGRYIHSERDIPVQGPNGATDPLSPAISFQLDEFLQVGRYDAPDAAARTLTGIQDWSWLTADMTHDLTEQGSTKLC
jgi:hypothetical protein